MPYHHISEITGEDWTITKGWPDLLCFKLSEQTGQLEAVFVVNRSSSRQFTLEKQATLRTMVLLGLEVRINTNGNLMTIDEFERAGLGSLGFNRQTVYNYRAQLKLLKARQASLPEGDPLRNQLDQQIEKREQIVGSYEAAKPPRPALLASSVLFDIPTVNRAYAERLARSVQYLKAKGKEVEARAIISEAKNRVERLERLAQLEKEQEVAFTDAEAAANVRAQIMVMQQQEQEDATPETPKS